MNNKDEVLNVILDWLEEVREKPMVGWVDADDPTDASLDGYFDLTELAERIANIPKEARSEVC